MSVPDNALSISIGNDGIVTVTQPGAAGINVQIGQLQIATFINPTGLQSVGENLYLETDASGPANLLQPGVDGADPAQVRGNLQRQRGRRAGEHDHHPARL